MTPFLYAMCLIFLMALVLPPWLTLLIFVIEDIFREPTPMELRLKTVPPNMTIRQALNTGLITEEDSKILMFWASI
jgi:hypothetical protein